ncbi:sulfite exporter TauE/SafE family protein [Geodermatophilus sp. SYSU D00696]
MVRGTFFLSRILAAAWLRFAGDLNRGRNSIIRDDCAGRARTARRPLWLAACAGAAVGLLSGLVGLGGAEFRLPLLSSLFAFAALSAVVVNKAMSLVVVTAALPSRLTAVPLDALAEHWFIAVSLLVGSLPGAWMGASWATRMRAATLHRVLGALLLAIAAVFGAEHLGTLPQLALPLGGQATAGVVAGFGSGVVAALMGVAGGELLVPTIVLPYAVGVKLAGSLSLLVSLPTMLVAFFRTAATGRSRCYATTAGSWSRWRSARWPGRSPADSCSARCRPWSSCRWSSCCCSSRR